MISRLSTQLKEVLKELPSSYLVGGCVRDFLLGIEPKDLDVEVYDISAENLVAVLSRHGQVSLVGQSFGVYKLRCQDNTTYDFSLPRRDSKITGGHKGFEISFGQISLKEAAQRRDLTINSLLYCPRTGNVLDFFGGISDLKNKILREISEESFVEDPLRPLRIFQFAARFGFSVASKTAELCRAMFVAGLHKELPKERISEEFVKFLLKGNDHLLGFKVLKEIGWLPLFPEIAALDGLHQDPCWHPEGDVLTHTAHCLAAMKKILAKNNINKNDDILTYFLAIFCHDFGKASTTFINNKGRIVSPGHDSAGEEPTRKFLSNLMISKDIVGRVIPLVVNHMVHLSITKDTNLDKFVKKLSVKLIPENIQGLSYIVHADHSGRPPLNPEMPQKMTQILVAAQNNKCVQNKSEPIIKGQHLIDLGMSPSVSFGIILRETYEAQLNGKFFDIVGGLEFIKNFPCNFGNFME